jgi:hypothetical protein
MCSPQGNVPIALKAALKDSNMTDNKKGTAWMDALDPNFGAWRARDNGSLSALQRLSTRNGSLYRLCDGSLAALSDGSLTDLQRLSDGSL